MEIMEYIERGGVIMYVLLALNIIGFTIMLWKMVEIWLAKREKESIIEGIVQKMGSIDDKHASLGWLKDEIGAKVKRLESGLNTVKIIASISPLLGLLGTVIGVLISFDAIAKVGMGDPSVFAGGISMALITTVGGLVVAIPHYIGYNYLIGMLDSIEVELEKDSIPKIYKG